MGARMAVDGARTLIFQILQCQPVPFLLTAAIKGWGTFDRTLDFGESIVCGTGLAHQPQEQGAAKARFLAAEIA